MAKPRLLTEIKPNTKLQETVEQYKKIKAQISFLEEQLKPYKHILEMACVDLGGQIITPHFKITLSLQERESFDLKRARLEIPETVEKYLLTHSYTVLRVV